MSAILADDFDIVAGRIGNDRSATRGGSRHRPEAKRATPSFRVLTKRPLTADAEEVARNPRARSAKLRAAERTSATAHPQRAEVLPRLPTPDEIMGRS